MGPIDPIRGTPTLPPIKQAITVNSLYSGHCRDLELVSSLARVRNRGRLFQSNICKLLFLSGM